MAMTITHKAGENKLTPWLIDYKTFNDPEHNAFFKAAPQLRHGG